MLEVEVKSGAGYAFLTIAREYKGGIAEASAFANWAPNIWGRGLVSDTQPYGQGRRLGILVLQP